ncbi:hypothetical protein J1605_001042 [Eschrichtius robustus]|uniref:Uncharacterized protein n=1 Tax=Eschrichtius robustus TaxID=9764 RepID=A0AB34GNH6_ESCRO|nr:hypothetical protein J1605_001042 [Eschrichtius robustus]
MAGVLGRQPHAGIGDAEVPHAGLCPGGARKGMTSAPVAMVTGRSEEASGDVQHLSWTLTRRSDLDRFQKTNAKTPPSVHTVLLGRRLPLCLPPHLPCTPCSPIAPPPLPAHLLHAEAEARVAPARGLARVPDSEGQSLPPPPHAGLGPGAVGKPGAAGPPEEAG